MTTRLYFHTEPAGGVGLYRETITSGVQRVAHIALDMSLDEADQRLLADEWLLSDQHPDPLPALAVRRIVARRNADRAQAAVSAVRDSGSADLGMALAPVGGPCRG